MAKCYYCGKEVAFPYRCKYCNHLFCVEHHLPEKHNCSGLKRNLKLNNIEEIGNRCDFCGKPVYLPYKCKFCGGMYCVEHHLPEKHNCIGLILYKMQRHEKITYLPSPTRTTFKKYRVPVSVKSQTVLTSDNFGRKMIYILLALFVSLMGILFSPILMLSFIPIPLVIAHELLHAFAFWYYGYSAIPIPIFIPPILGICIGQKPHKRSERIAVSLAPQILTIMGFILGIIGQNYLYIQIAIYNLFGSTYDIISIFLH